MANTIFSDKGLALNILEPPWRGGNLVGNYSEDVTSYTHEIAVTGGFISANLTLKQPFSTLEDWVENGLSREIQITTSGKGIVFNGFINQIDVTIEGYHLVIGPYMDIGNKIKLVYSTVDTSTVPPTIGFRASSAYITDAQSIAKYGTLISVLSSGGIAVGEVAGILALALEKTKRSSRSEDITLGGAASAFNLKVDILGYYAMFEKYPYNQTVTNGLTNLSDKIKAVVLAEPNNLFSLGEIQVNTTQVPAYENDDLLASALLKDAANLGDATGNRYELAVYRNRRVIYRAIPQTVTYIRPLREGNAIIYTAGGTLVEPWDVRPGGWVVVTDLLPAKPLNLDISQDIRALFVESVTFTAPDQLTINGSHTFAIARKLASLGISGISL